MHVSRTEPNVVVRKVWLYYVTSRLQELLQVLDVGGSRVYSQKLYIPLRHTLKNCIFILLCLINAYTIGYSYHVVKQNCELKGKLNCKKTSAEQHDVALIEIVHIFIKL